MTGSHREPTSTAEDGSRARIGRSFRTRAPAFALGSAAVVAISGIAFAAETHSPATGYAQGAAATRNLCGRPYRLPKPITPQFNFRDPHSSGIRGLAFCGNGSVLAAADGNGHVYLWSMATHRIVGALHDPRGKGVNAVAYRSRSTVLAAGDGAGAVYLWQRGHARPRRLAVRGSRGVRGVAFSPDGALLAVADGDGCAYIWSMRAFRVVAVLRDAGSKGVSSVAFGAGGSTVATGDANGSSYVWVLSRGLRARLQHRLRDVASKGVTAVAFSRGGGTLAIADANGRDYVWVPGSKRPRVLTDPATRGVDSEGFTPNGRFLAAGDAGGRLFFWALSTYQVVEFLPAHKVRAIHAAAFSPDGRRAAAGAADGTIYLADVSRIGIDVAFTAVRAGT